MLSIDTVLIAVCLTADASEDESPAAAPVAVPAVAPKKGKFADEDASDDDVKVCTPYDKLAKTLRAHLSCDRTIGTLQTMKKSRNPRNLLDQLRQYERKVSQR